MAKHNQKTILVTGATGTQGGAALRHLRKRGFPVRALTRDPDRPDARKLFAPGVEVVRGDQHDMASLTRALDVQASEEGFDSEVSQGINVAEAANRAAIDYFVYSSVASADRNTGIPHFDSKYKIEQHIQNAGLRYTIFRPVFFMENLLQMKDSIDQGNLYFPLKPETRLQMVAADDIGWFAATAFEHTGRWRNRVVELAGDEVSMEQLAALIGRAAGRAVQYVQIPWEQLEQQMGKEMTIMFRWFESEGYHVDIDALRQEHPGLLRLELWLSLHWPKAAS